MKLVTSSLILVLAGVVAAQSACSSVAAAIPSCGVRPPLSSFPLSQRNSQENTLTLQPTKTSCIISAGSAVSCSQTDYACQCSSSQSAAIQSSALNCVISACGIQTALLVQSSAQAVCSCVSAHPATHGNLIVRATNNELQQDENGEFDEDEDEECWRDGGYCYFEYNDEFELESWGVEDGEWDVDFDDEFSAGDDERAGGG
ncbi:hypothetical protein G7Y89_g14911 [Cudoniella acicularis]|uniref:CFEM domain-containing protein n=1 Tax=Cudoniella acicularis TaxID=354080 RepID=A0A8H4QVX3_9HELO|nr:hypothetical protein G7Y89_g14911 [Cudoniella acicularis]